MLLWTMLWFPAFERASGDQFLEWYTDTEIQKLKSYGFRDDDKQIKELEALRSEKNHEEAKEKLISYLLLGPHLNPEIKFYLMRTQPLKTMEKEQLLEARNRLISKLNELMMNGRITAIEINPEEIKFRLKADHWPPFKEVQWIHDEWKSSVIAYEKR